jgi:hypothetical protein
MGVEESEQDKEAVSSNSASSEEVEIYLNDLGLDNGVGSDHPGTACGMHNAGECHSVVFSSRFPHYSRPPSYLIFMAIDLNAGPR